MKETSKKGEKFYDQWEERRKKKWLFVFLHGSVYWGLPVAVATFLLNSHFKFENMHLSQLIISIMVFGIGGLGFGLHQFKRIDSIYLGLGDRAEIQKGIYALKSGQTWNYENLKISFSDVETLLVRNELFWYMETPVPPEKLNQCFNLILDDFRRLQKAPNFGEFSKNLKIKVQVFDNSESESPLIEKIAKS